MTPKPRPPAVCPKCEAPIAWWPNANRPGMIPVDLSSDSEKGSIQKIVTRTPGPRGIARETVVASKLSGADLAAAIANGEMLFTHHSDTCTALRPVNPRPDHVHLDLPPRRHGPQPGSARHRARGRR